MSDLGIVLPCSMSKRLHAIRMHSYAFYAFNAFYAFLSFLCILMHSMHSSSFTLLPGLDAGHQCTLRIPLHISCLQLQGQMSIPVLQLHYLFVDKSILQDLAQKS